MSNNRPAPHLRQFAPVKYKKAPQAPRRFKSSYMFFSTKKHKEIRAELAEKGEGNKVSSELNVLGRFESTETRCFAHPYFLILILFALVAFHNGSSKDGFTSMESAPG